MKHNPLIKSAILAGSVLFAWLAFAAEPQDDPLKPAPAEEEAAPAEEEAAPAEEEAAPAEEEAAPAEEEAAPAEEAAAPAEEAAAPAEEAAAPAEEAAAPAEEAAAPAEEAAAPAEEAAAPAEEAAAPAEEAAAPAPAPAVAPAPAPSAKAPLASFEPAPSAKAPLTPYSDLAVSFGVGYTTEDVFRGNNRGDDLFDASIGVSGSASAGGLGELYLSAGLHILTRSVSSGSVSVADTAGAHELRVNLEASKPLGNFDLALGITNYTGFGAWSSNDDILEPYVALSTELAGLAVGIGAFDTEDEDDPYIEITAGKAVDLGGLGLSVQGVIGSLDTFDNVHYGLSVGMPIAASDSITVTPHVSAIFGDTTSGDNEFTAGVNLGFGF